MKKKQKKKQKNSSFMQEQICPVTMKHYQYLLHGEYFDVLLFWGQWTLLHCRKNQPDW